jgi:hypothetical protein
MSNKVKRRDIVPGNIFRIAGNSQHWGNNPSLKKGQIVRVDSIYSMKGVKIRDLQGNNLGFIDGYRLRKL